MLNGNQKRMIVDTMSLNEVGEAILKASQKSMSKIVALLLNKDKAYRRVIIKEYKERYDFQKISFTTDGIEFNLCPYSEGKKDYKKYGISYFLIAHVFYKGTNWYCIIANHSQSVELYCNHFFERYVERHLKDDSEINVELVRKYFMEINKLTAIRRLEHPKYKDCIYGATNIGVCCGQMVSNQVMVLKTYIDKETLTLGEKKLIYDDGQKRLEAFITNEIGIREFEFAA